jgi:glycosyltransferase involved in cell wall biosynthesis
MRCRRLSVVYVEPFYGGSHRAFIDSWIAHSRHRWRLVSLPAARWKWRMRLAGIELGEQLARFERAADVVVVTPLLDLAHLRWSAGAAWRRARWLVYWHENQFSYPRPRGEPLDRGFVVAHVATLRAGDQHAFNSQTHRRSMITSFREALKELPRELRGAADTRWIRRTRVLPPGVDFAGFPVPAPREAGQPPRLLWNHRWEADKRPSAFARCVAALAERDLAFRLILLGMVDQIHPQPLLQLRTQFAQRIDRDGPARTRREYISWLTRADIAVTTAVQENFGFAAVEAMAAGAVPLLPRRLSYPELIPRRLHHALLYTSDRDLLARLGVWLRQPAQFTALRQSVMRAAQRHDWTRRVEALDRWVEGESR